MKQGRVQLLIPLLKIFIYIPSTFPQAICPLIHSSIESTLLSDVSRAAEQGREERSYYADKAEGGVVVLKTQHAMSGDVHGAS